MSLRRNRPAAGERLLQQFKAGNARHGKLTPVRQAAAAAFTCDLIGKEMCGFFLNAIIVRLYDSDFIEIGEPQQASLMNGRQDALMNARIDCGRSRMPYYADWASHWFIISDLQPVDDTETRLY
jgi:hypothetical protein